MIDINFVSWYINNVENFYAVIGTASFVALMVVIIAKMAYRDEKSEKDKNSKKK